jgi:hypothetical protein
MRGEHAVIAGFCKQLHPALAKTEIQASASIEPGPQGAVGRNDLVHSNGGRKTETKQGITDESLDNGRFS